MTQLTDAEALVVFDAAFAKRREVKQTEEKIGRLKIRLKEEMSEPPLSDLLDQIKKEKARLKNIEQEIVDLMHQGATRERLPIQGELPKGEGE